MEANIGNYLFGTIPNGKRVFQKPITFKQKSLQKAIKLQDYYDTYLPGIGKSVNIALILYNYSENQTINLINYT